MALYENEHNVRLKGFWNDPVSCVVSLTDEMIQIRHKRESIAKTAIRFMFAGAAAVKRALDKLELDIPYYRIKKYGIGRDRLRTAMSIEFEDADNKNKTVIIYGNKSDLDKIENILNERCNL